ncbi:MAG: GGDEF domain-containing protein [Eubacteriales bacterium]
METRAYLELLYNDSSNPYYFAGMKSHEIIFLNKVMEKKLRSFDDVVGKKCYKVIHNSDRPCSFCPMDSLKESEFLEQRIFNELTRSYHRANSTVINVNDEKICLCKYFVAFAKERNPVLSYDKAIEKCVGILSESEQSESIGKFMALLGQFYQCDHSFIFDLDNETHEFQSVFMWHGVDSEETFGNNGDKKYADDFLLWISAVTMSGMVEINSANTYPSNSFEKRLLDLYPVKNLVLHPIKNRIGKIMGFLGLSDYKVKAFDPRLIKTVSRFVETNHSKNVMVSELRAVNYLDSLTGFYNRKRYVELVRELEESPPHSLGVLFVSLAGLRRVNDKRGFEEGNALIEASALFLKENFREHFYRLSGDEFVCFILDSLEGDFYKKITDLEEGLKDENAPELHLGCAWENAGINVLRLVADAANNVRDY